MNVINNFKSCKNYWPFSPYGGIHVLPVILNREQISEIYKVAEIKSHHDDGHGSGGHDTGDDEEKAITVFKAEKPYNFPDIAELIYSNITTIRLSGGYKSVAVDPNMQVYTLPEGGGVVPVHVDKDFELNKFHALYSILIYLNDGYTGGQTVFNQNMYAPEVPVGAGILFRHHIIHQGLEVVSGEKHILKTDLLFTK